MKKSREKVLIELTTIPETAWYFFRGRLRFFQEKGFKVYLISGPGELLEKIKEREGVEVISVGFTREFSPFKDLIVLLHLFWIFLKLKPLIVHTHTPKASLLGILASTLLRVPLRFYTLHGIDYEARGARKWFLKMTDFLCSRLSDQTFCVSRTVAEFGISQKLIPARKVKVLLKGSVNGVDYNYFNPERFGNTERAELKKQLKIPESALVIGYVGRIVRDKGMIELAKAWKSLREEFPGLHLLLIGPFEQANPVPAWVKELFQTDPRIHLTGFITELAPFYLIMDLVVFPTYREGFPYVPLEAQAMRVPVITTNVPGAKESIVDGITGILVPAKDVPRLTQALRDLILNPSLRENMGKAGRERMLRDFRPEDFWSALHQEYLQFLKEKGISG